MLYNLIKYNFKSSTSRVSYTLLNRAVSNSTHFSNDAVKLQEVEFSSNQSNSIEKKTKSQNSLKYKYKTGTLELSHKTLARLADSSATGQYNNTNILVTVVNKPKNPPASFLPLTVMFIYFQTN
jgi:polyribonucleotide nucleotidyltransferase